MFVLQVHVVHSYDRIIPYIGHKRLTVVTPTPTVVRVRPSTLYREFDRIENKLRPYTYNSYTNDYLNSDSHVVSVCASECLDEIETGRKLLSCQGHANDEWWMTVELN